MPLRTLLPLLTATLLHAQTYDIVIRNGRVKDPETKLDAIRNVGIRNGKIATVTTNSLDGKRVIDATGMIVAPGFIDLHWHGREPSSDRYEAMDGVTSSLELEIGTADVDGWYRAREANRSSITVSPPATHPFAWKSCTTPATSSPPTKPPSTKPPTRTSAP